MCAKPQAGYSSRDNRHGPCSSRSVGDAMHEVRGELGKGEAAVVCTSGDVISAHFEADGRTLLTYR